jgi:hypothetical protein
MRLSTKAVATLLVATALQACSAPVPLVITYQSQPSQELSPTSSMLWGACTGADVSNGLRLTSGTVLTADFTINSVDGGFEHPYAKIAAPVNTGDSQMVLPIFSANPGPVECGGSSLRTVLRRENGTLYVAWTLEVSRTGGTTAAMPVDAWMVQGETAVPASGYASGHVAFYIGNRAMIAHIKLNPGPVWTAKQNADRLKQYELQNPLPVVATPLPDEEPGQTLDDVTNPNYVAPTGQ